MGVVIALVRSRQCRVDPDPTAGGQGVQLWV